MGRAPCCDKANVKRGPWSPEEDAKLKSYIQDQGTGGNWIALPQKIGLKRCGKSCRLRWLNYLRPNIKHGGFSDEEDNIICTLYMSIGSRWSIIAAQLPGRTDNDIKNYWNTRLKKKLMMGAKQRKEVHLQSRRSYVKVKPHPENNIMMIKKSVEDPDAISHLQIQSSLPSYYTPRLPPDDQATNNMPYLANPYPIPYPTHDPSQPPHQIKKNQETSTNFDFPFHISSGTVENCQLFNDNNNTIHFPANYSTQTYSSDLQSYLSNFPGIDQMNETLSYGFDESKYLCGVDTVNGAGSFTGTSNSAESTSWKGDINSFVCSPIVSNINIYEEVRQLGISTFEEPVYNLGIH